MSQSRPSHILVFRFSALGDVVMTIPVIKLLLQQHPDLEVTFVSAPFHRPLFRGINRLHFYPVDVKKDYNGVSGLFNLAKKLKKEIDFDAVADLHDVLRTKVIRNFLGNKQTAIINKGRKQKKELTRTKNKKLRPLKTTFERYADVFKELGRPVKLLRKDGIIHLQPNNKLLPFEKNGNSWVGIAPFAGHDSKMYPLDKMHKVVEILQKQKNITLFLFGSAAEAEVLTGWAGTYENIYVVAGRHKFDQELNIISQMDVMVSMDSANMHLASLYGVPVVSLWGGTHPFAGFYGWAQDIENALQLDLPCRPSSVYGKKDCPVHGKKGCMQDITPQMVADKVNSVLNK